MNKRPDSIPFDWNCEWGELYIGSTKKRHTVDYQEFTCCRSLFGQLDCDVWGWKIVSKDQTLIPNFAIVLIGHILTTYALQY